MLVLKVAPTQEQKDFILDLVELKDFLKILDTDHDTDLSNLLESSFAEAQDITNRVFASATFEYFRSRFTDIICIPKNPLIEVTEISILQDDGSYLAVDSTDYYIFEEYDVSKIVFLNTSGVSSSLTLPPYIHVIINF